MSKCPDCRTEMKPLFSGEYCPNDCDKPELKAAKAKTEYERQVEALKNATVDPLAWITRRYLALTKPPTSNYT